MWTDLGNIHINRSQTHECGHWDSETAQFLFWEYIKGIFAAVWLLLSPEEGKTYPGQLSSRLVDDCAEVADVSVGEVAHRRELERLVQPALLKGCAHVREKGRVSPSLPISSLKGHVLPT
jgi:hypothetical protein